MCELWTLLTRLQLIFWVNFKVFVDQASIRDRRLIADFSFISRPLLEVGVNSEGACNWVNTVCECDDLYQASQCECHDLFQALQTNIRTRRPRSNRTSPVRRLFASHFGAHSAVLAPSVYTRCSDVKWFLYGEWFEVWGAYGTVDDHFLAFNVTDHLDCQQLWG